MNRIRLSAIILAIVTVICIGEYLYIDKTVTDFTEKIDNIEEALETQDHELALELAESADDKWQEHLPYIDMLLYHDYIDEISGNFAGLKKYIKYGEDAEFFATAERTKRELKSLIQSEKPLAENII